MCLLFLKVFSFPLYAHNIFVIESPSNYVIARNEELALCLSRNEAISGFGIEYSE